MPQSMTLSVVAPDRTVFEGQVKSLCAPGVMGYLGVMADHEPSIVALKPGIVETTDESDNRHMIAIGGGFLETSGKGAIILADDARLASEIEIAVEQANLEQALKALRGEDSSMTSEEAREVMDRALARLKLVKGA